MQPDKNRSHVHDIGLAVKMSYVRCATCGYGAWRDGYPCNRCGGLESRTFVAVDALLSHEATVAYQRAYDAEPVIPWDEDKPLEEQDFSEHEAGMRAAIAVASSEQERPDA